jgi:stearoyl-CoA desaturase (delta-9 desaturase)
MPTTTTPEPVQQPSIRPHDAALAAGVQPTIPTVPVEPAAPAPQGVRARTQREVRFQRRAVLVATIAPVIALAVAVSLAWGHGGLHASDAIAFAVMYLVSGFGVTVGYHRLLTHASFDTHPRVRAAFAVAGTLAVEGGVIDWVANHRRHHAMSDKVGDPHSPHVWGDHDHEPGLRALIGGLWHAHVGWMFRTTETERTRWAADLLREPLMVRVDAATKWILLATLVLPTAIGFALTGTAYGALTALLWGGFVRILVLHHATWSINSVCHVFGSRPWQSGDESTNNWPLALLSLGESWHNTHHAFPSSAVHGLERGQVDVSAWLIRGMERVGLARNVRTPSEQARASKRRSS